MPGVRRFCGSREHGSMPIRNGTSMVQHTSAKALITYPINTLSGPMQQSSAQSPV